MLPHKFLFENETNSSIMFIKQSRDEMLYWCFLCVFQQITLFISVQTQFGILWYMKMDRFLYVFDLLSQQSWAKLFLQVMWRDTGNQSTVNEGEMKLLFKSTAFLVIRLASQIEQLCLRAKLEEIKYLSRKRISTKHFQSSSWIHRYYFKK